MTLNDILVLHFSFEGFRVHEYSLKRDDVNVSYTLFINKEGNWRVVEQTVNGTNQSWRFANCFYCSKAATAQATIW